MPRKEAFDLLIPNRRLHEMEQLARTRTRSGFRKGLRVRVRGESLTARIYEASRTSTAPSLNARMQDEANGLRVTGQVDWSYVEMLPYIMATIALFAVVIVGMSIADGQWLIVTVALLFVAGFSYLSVATFRGKANTKSYETVRLQDELIDMFQGPQRSGRH